MQNSETIFKEDQNGTVDPKVYSSTFLAGVLALAGGAAVAQGIGLITSPIICRIFSPEVFGLAGIFSSVVMVISVLTCLRYELAIMLPKKQEDTATLFVFCCILTVIATCFTGIAVIYFGPGLMRTLEAEQLIPYLWLVPVCVLLAGLALPFRSWSNRNQQYKHLGYSRIISSASKNFALITGGVLGYRTVVTLIVCMALESGIAVITLFRRVIFHDLPSILQNFKISNMLPLAKRYIKFPMISSLSTLMNTSVYQIPVFLFAYYLGITVVGYYSRCLLLLGMPLTLISGAISTVFYQRVTKWKNEGRSVDILVEGVFLRLLYLMILPFALVALFGKDIYSIVLGNQWSEAGVYASILVPRYLFLATTTPLMTIFAAFEKQGFELIFNILLTVFTIGAIVIGGSVLGDARLTILLFSLAGTIAYILRLTYILSLAKASLRRLIRQLVPYLVYTLPLLIIITVSRWWLGLPLPWLLVVLVAILVIYYILVLHRDEYLRRILRILLQEVRSRNET